MSRLVALATKRLRELKMQQSVASITNKPESAQITFFDKVEKLFTEFKAMGNPFEEEFADLLVLDTNYVADAAKSRTVAIYQSRGKVHFQSFIKGLKKEEQTLYYQPLKKNKITFFEKEEISIAESSKRRH